jgi:hypothetical protein
LQLEGDDVTPINNSSIMKEESQINDFSQFVQANVVSPARSVGKFKQSPAINASQGQ